VVTAVSGWNIISSGKMGNTLSGFRCCVLFTWKVIDFFVETFSVLAFTIIFCEKEPVERRFQLISGIARYGFNTSIRCFGKIYLPEIPPETRIRFEPADNVPLLAMTIGPKVTQGPEDSDSDDVQEPDAPDLMPYSVIEVFTTAIEYQRRGLR